MCVSRYIVNRYTRDIVEAGEEGGIQQRATDLARAATENININGYVKRVIDKSYVAPRQPKVVVVVTNVG